MKTSDSISLELLKIKMQIEEINKDLNAAHEGIREIKKELSGVRDGVVEADKGIIKLNGELNPISKIVWAVTLATIGNAISLVYMFISNK